jgi:hypothetical protein
MGEVFIASFRATGLNSCGAAMGVGELVVVSEANYMAMEK